MEETPRPTTDAVNVADHLTHAARHRPMRRAVVCPAGRDRYGRTAYAHLTFDQLERESGVVAYGLKEAGIDRGTRTILMVRPSIEFFVLVFALFKLGAVPVVVDPGMGIRRLLACYRSTRPQAFIGIPLAHAVRVLCARHFRSVRTRITVGRRWFWGGPTLRQLRARCLPPFETARTRADEPAAILFTTGSTGPAKGAVYTHGNFDAQLDQIRRHLAFDDDEIDLSTFPLFALFYPALGVTAVIPEMDPTRPARANPERIFEAVANHGVTNMFASPALLQRLGAYGGGKGIRLHSLKRVICAGAPVPPRTLERFADLLTADARIETPYGATEAVPVTSITAREILAETRPLTDQGFGICVGRPINDVAVRIIAVSDEPIRQWSQELVLPPGEIGEIAVRGGLVSRRYFENPAADRLAKIPQDGEVWHRMGDLGWVDRKERIWFCGRKSHRVITPGGTLYTIPCESIFNRHPAVLRSALVGVGPPPHQVPVICIELLPAERRRSRRKLKAELLALAKEHEITQPIRVVLFRRRFPVDIRHNAKIFREQLADWARKKIGPADLRRLRETERLHADAPART
ncbi:MAG: fatty acid CoA ligase family protein [Desulfobacterales bacterium]|jgi:acyl-CoA synthetase (AMP-forming)/AMP-acid ligase II|nr:fatty acid CoA ligase family protein [Desulfobacterales bacterium]